MPVVNFPLPEIDQLVARPVVLAVVEQLKQITNIPQETDVTFVGQGGSRMQFPHTTSPGQTPVKLAADNMLTVDVDEQPDESMFATTVGNAEEHQYDFLDGNLGLELKPVYCGFEYVATVTYRTPSRSEAIRWRNDARYKASQMRTTNLHELEYQYQLPPAAMIIARHIHSLREAKCGYGQSFDEYFTQGLTSRATQASTVTGTHPEILIREKQFRVQGTFDFTFNPARQDRNEGNGWEVQFTYTFSFHKPVVYSVRYPIVVHNQAIDTRFIPLEPKDPTEVDKRMSLSVSAMHYMEAPVVMRRETQYESIHYSPAFDRWKPDVQPFGQTLVASFLLGVEDGYQGKILNLHELGDYSIDSDVMAWIDASEWPYIQLPYTSPVQIQLYRNECLSAPQAITVNAQGDVILNEVADGRKRYRIALTLCKKISQCDPRSLKRLAKFPDAMCKILSLTKTTSGEIYGMLPRVDLQSFVNCAISAGQSRQQAIESIVSIKTVMSAGVLAERMDSPSALLALDKLIDFKNPR